ncbi:MAG: hypothetical protein F6J97_24315, partial [Leptolyngbya sp. SIO4C1]|nr:hypothetical protein [Leptolyngbya sp. SIO4C1]
MERVNQQQWHTLDVSQTLTLLATNSKGLSSEQAQQRQAEYGPNELDKTGGRSRWRILIDQFTNIMLLMLIGVAIVSAVLDFRAGADRKV